MHTHCKLAVLELWYFSALSLTVLFVRYSGSGCAWPLTTCQHAKFWECVRVCEPTYRMAAATRLRVDQHRHAHAHAPTAARCVQRAQHAAACSCRLHVHGEPLAFDHGSCPQGAHDSKLSAAAEAAGPHDGGACYSARMDFSRASKLLAELGDSGSH